MTYGSGVMLAEIRDFMRTVGGASIDYEGAYIKLYIAYNSWYRRVTYTSSDRQAIVRLKMRYGIWEAYEDGRSLGALRVGMAHICDLTQREPLVHGPTLHWDGVVNDMYDWRSLIEYWYRVRCMLVHGEGVGEQYVRLAHESLRIFMKEIVSRMAVHLESIQSKENVYPVGTLKNRHELYVEYMKVWEVDMEEI